MRTDRLAVSASSAALAFAGVIACATEQSTSPTSPVARVPKSMVFNLAGSTTANGDLIVCKTGDAGSFTVVFDAPVLGVRSFDALQVRLDNGLTLAGTRTYTFSLAAGQCRTLFTRPVVAGVVFDPNVRATIIEAADRTLLSIATNVDNSGNPGIFNLANRSATVEFNMYHDALVTFVNAAPTPVCDFVTYGGFVLEPNNVSYAGNAGVTSKDVLFGELNFKNHENGDLIHLHTIASYVQDGTDEDTRRISGPATVNGESGFTATVWLTDNGEPGTSDRIRLVVTNAGGQLITDQTVNGGNIQLHHVCRPAPLNGPTQ